MSTRAKEPHGSSNSPTMTVKSPDKPSTYLVDEIQATRLAEVLESACDGLTWELDNLADLLRWTSQPLPPSPALADAMNGSLAANDDASSEPRAPLLSESPASLLHLGQAADRIQAQAQETLDRLASGDEEESEDAEEELDLLIDEAIELSRALEPQVRMTTMATLRDIERGLRDDIEPLLPLLAPPAAAWATERVQWWKRTLLSAERAGRPSFRCDDAQALWSHMGPVLHQRQLDDSLFRLGAIRSRLAALASDRQDIGQLLETAADSYGEPRPGAAESYATPASWIARGRSLIQRPLRLVDEALMQAEREAIGGDRAAEISDIARRACLDSWNGLRTLARQVKPMRIRVQWLQQLDSGFQRLLTDLDELSGLQDNEVTPESPRAALS